MKTRTLRVRAYTVREPMRGYLGLHETHYQDLEQRRWWGWQVIDTEEVPRDVLITLGTMGDTGGWKSRFATMGTFGRDGILTPHADKPVLVEPAQAALAA